MMPMIVSRFPLSEVKHHFLDDDRILIEVVQSADFPYRIGRSHYAKSKGISNIWDSFGCV